MLSRLFGTYNSAQLEITPRAWVDRLEYPACKLPVSTTIIGGGYDRSVCCCTGELLISHRLWRCCTTSHNTSLVAYRQCCAASALQDCSALASTLAHLARCSAGVALMPGCWVLQGDRNDIASKGMRVGEGSRGRIRVVTVGCRHATRTCEIPVPNSRVAACYMIVS